MFSLGGGSLAPQPRMNLPPPPTSAISLSELERSLTQQQQSVGPIRPPQQQQQSTPPMPISGFRPMPPSNDNASQQLGQFGLQMKGSSDGGPRLTGPPPVPTGPFTAFGGFSPPSMPGRPPAPFGSGLMNLGPQISNPFGLGLDPASLAAGLAATATTQPSRPLQLNEMPPLNLLSDIRVPSTETSTNSFGLGRRNADDSASNNRLGLSDPFMRPWQP